jgi:uncharacterized membrane protein
MIKLSTILKKDAVMITFLVLCMIVILYASNYNTNYDKVIHSYYKTYLKEQCICKDELPLANRIPVTNLSNKGKNNLVITHESKN